MKFKRGTKLNGRAVMSLLNFDNYKEGADMRHVLHAAYQLKPKCISKMKFKRGTKLNGRAVMSLLNFDNYKEKEEEVEQKQRMSRAWAEYEQRLNRGKGVKPPPGFESLD